MSSPILLVPQKLGDADEERIGTLPAITRTGLLEMKQGGQLIQVHYSGTVFLVALPFAPLHYYSTQFVQCVDRPLGGPRPRLIVGRSA